MPTEHYHPYHRLQCAWRLSVANYARKMNAEWAIHYFDPQTGRETESRRLSSLEEAVSLAETYERQGCSVRFLASPHGKMNWPLSKRTAPR